MNAEQAKCPDCKGRGTKPHPHIPRYVRVYCERCEGTGRIAKKRRAQRGPRSSAARGSETPFDLAPHVAGTMSGGGLGVGGAA